jgi:hypothetical protein
MAGLAGCPVGYIRSMAMWSKLNRQDGDLPFDIINVHTYCRSYINVNGAQIAVGSSPESFGLVESLQELIDWRDTYYPEKEIWLTEFGWDTNEDYLTEQSSHSYGEYTSRQVQAMWMVRSYLLLSASGSCRPYRQIRPCNRLRPHHRAAAQIRITRRVPFSSRSSFLFCGWA